MKGSPAFAAALADAAARAGRPLRIWTPDGAAPLEPARPRQRDRAQGQADRDRAVHRAPLPARRGAVRPDRSPGRSRAHTRSGRRRSSEVVRTDGPAQAGGLAAGAPPAARGARPGLPRGPDARPAERGPRAPDPARDHHRVPHRALPGAVGARDRTSTCARRCPAARWCCSASTRARTGSSPRSSARSRFRTSCAPPATGSRKAPVTPATVAIDEASVLGENLISLFARSREAGIGVLAATQELADFDRVAPGLRDQVLGQHRVQGRPPPGRPVIGPDRGADGRHREDVGVHRAGRRRAGRAATGAAAGRAGSASSS